MSNRFTRPALVLCLLCLVLIAAQRGAASQGVEVVIKVDTAEGYSVPFKAAFASPDGGLEIVEDVTPFERRIPGGFAVGIVERTMDGPDLQTSISIGASRSVAAGRRVIVGSNLMKGIETFVRTF